VSKQIYNPSSFFYFSFSIQLTNLYPPRNTKLSTSTLTISHKKFMKRAILFAGLLATQFTFAQQQTNSLELGIHAGTSLSSLLNAKSPFATLRPRAGVQVGLMTALSVQYQFAPHFSVQTGLVYEEKGARVKASANSRSEWSRYSTEFSRKVDNAYLTLPLLLGWQTTGRLGVAVRAGGFVSRLVYARIRGKDSQTVVSLFTPPNSLPSLPSSTSVSEFSGDFTPRTFALDYGGSFGGSLFYALNDKLKLSLNALLNVSLRKLDSTHDNDVVVMPRGNGFVEYKYDYFGLNSRARNVSLPVHLGLSYRLF
jgi:hypothetical protein